MADTCRLESSETVDMVTNRIGNIDMVIIVCRHCENNGPVPLRIKKIEFKHFEPKTVSVPFYNETFPVDALIEAEQKGTGALSAALRARIEKEYEDETGYLPNDPYLIQEKLDRYQLLLNFTREDYEMRIWDELLINGEPVDPARIYYPVGDNEYQSLGMEVGCDIDKGVPKRVSYEPIVRDPEKVAPPGLYIADVTHQCYDGSCPAPEWVVSSPTPYFDHAEGQQIGVMDTGEIVKPLKTLSHVTAAKAIAIKDHGHIFEGDIFYLLDSLAEGFYRFWHYGNIFIADASGVRIKGIWNYCEQENNCWAEADTRPTSIWWSMVKRQNGETIWLREPLNTLSGVLVD